MDALILSHYKIKPEQLDEEDYVRYFSAIDFKLKADKRVYYNACKQALVEVVNDLFSNEERA